VVVDTNVLVSALLKPGSVPSQVVMRVLAGEATCCWDARIVAEYTEVLARPRFDFRPSDQRDVLTGLAAKAIPVIADRVEITLVDEDDRPFFEVAAARAFLVTGNARHFPPHPLVTSPAAFLRLLDGRTPAIP
jgi:predicted nucleic acid-binding protein